MLQTIYAASYINRNKKLMCNLVFIYIINFLFFITASKRPKELVIQRTLSATVWCSPRWKSKARVSSTAWNTSFSRERYNNPSFTEPISSHFPRIKCTALSTQTLDAILITQLLPFSIWRPETLCLTLSLSLIMINARSSTGAKMVEGGLIKSYISTSFSFVPWFLRPFVSFTMLCHCLTASRLPSSVCSYTTTGLRSGTT